MSIDRYALVSGHDPVLKDVDTASPLTVGNGELAFTADITGLQTLYGEYKETLPLCTMSQWGWHTKPVSDERYEYTLDDLVMTEFTHNVRKVIFPKNPKPGNEEVYEWLRKNPHRLNLARIGFEYLGREPKKEQLDKINQRLSLYSGILKSSFILDGVLCNVETACDSESDTIGFSAESELIADGRLTLAMRFPYGSHTISASDFSEEAEALHTTTIEHQGVNCVVIKRVLDKDIYYVTVKFNDGISIEHEGHKVVFTASGSKMDFTVHFSKAPVCEKKLPYEFAQIKADSTAYWKKFWENGAIIQLHNSPDPRANELERRIILSLYLMAVNSCGSAPPQETGLTCNSWYGKMHLEMYFWHCAFAPLWKHTELLERSLPWYLEHLPEARENAQRNKYKGVRWPKMIALQGIDCPSKVAPMLIWQQPHIIFMLELAYRENKSREFLEKYWVLVKETAEFMADLAVYDEEKGQYDLLPPVIPVQECHRPEETKNPAFEVAYWKYTLYLAVEWAKRLGVEYDERWSEIADNMAGLTQQNGLYLAHEYCTTTYEVQNHDHPSMLMAYGVLPDMGVDEEVMRATLDKVLECWDYPTLWGWDFAVMAMTAVRLNNPELAIDILLKDTPKNDYVVSGNNRQKLRKDLPLYLPGNGSLLLAIPLMAAGYEGCDREHPGFPKDWVVEVEDMQVYV